MTSAASIDYMTLTFQLCAAMLERCPTTKLQVAKRLFDGTLKIPLLRLILKAALSWELVTLWTCSTRWGTVCEMGPNK